MRFFFRLGFCLTIGTFRDVLDQFILGVLAVLIVCLHYNGVVADGVLLGVEYALLGHGILGHWDFGLCLGDTGIYFWYFVCVCVRVYLVSYQDVFYTLF